MRFVNALDFLDTLQFDDQLILDENVTSVSTIEPNILVLYRQSKLELKGDSVATQFMGQALVVGRFEQSWAEVTVYFDGTTDHTIRKLVEFHLRALRVLRGCYLSVGLLSTP